MSGIEYFGNNQALPSYLHCLFKPQLWGKLCCGTWGTPRPCCSTCSSHPGVSVCKGGAGLGATFQGAVRLCLLTEHPGEHARGCRIDGPARTQQTPCGPVQGIPWRRHSTEGRCPGLCKHIWPSLRHFSVTKSTKDIFKPSFPLQEMVYVQKGSCLPVFSVLARLQGSSNSQIESSIIQRSVAQDLATVFTTVITK